MKKLVGILAVVGAVGGIAWAVLAPITETANDAAPEADPAPAQPAKVPEVAPAAEPPAASDVVGDAGAELSADEQAIMRMYSEMGAVLQQQTEDCKAMAEGVGSVITAHDAEIKRVMTNAQKRGQQEAREADKRILAAGGEQMDRFSSVLRTALDKCNTELQPVLKRLTALRGD